ncbi:hypothetical protein Thpro_023013 [Acidihalobacter prosperus]|uniref:Uncharacterized protein n=1 Tax=Acidihalobacter prosperus TaxID=160660 RepID=A0A1A6C2I2_9GAMM|nr:hypothetical protein Thpro_023013 [Acidihalobacter prosperus]
MYPIPDRLAKPLAAGIFRRPRSTLLSQRPSASDRHTTATRPRRT